MIRIAKKIVYLTCLLGGGAMVTAEAAPRSSLNPIDPGIQQQINRQLDNNLLDKNAADVQSPTEVVKHPDASLDGEKTNNQIKFMVSSVKFTHSDVFSEKELSSFSAPYIGKEQTFKDIQSLIDKINAAYRAKGIVSSLAILPAQSVSNGVVRIKLIEGRIGKIIFNGNDSSRTLYLLNWIKQKPGNLPDVAALERELVRFNYTHSAKMAAQLVPGDVFGLSDIKVTIKEPEHHNFTQFSDNFGSESTGRFRAGLVYQNSSLFGFYDSLNLMYTKSSGAESSLFSYQAPIGYWGTRIGASYSLDKTKIKYGEYQDLKITGRAENATFSLMQPVYFTSNTFIDGSLVYSRSRIKSWIQDYSIQNGLDASWTLGFELQSDNTKGGYWNASLKQSNVKYTTLEKDTNNYNITRASLYHIEVIKPGWYVRAGGNAMYSAQESLPSSEQFVLGGQGSVRGYENGLFSGDKGFALTAELHHPFLSYRDVLSSDGAFFIDHGAVYPYRPKNSIYGNSRYAITGVGWNLNIRFSRYVSAQISLASAVNKRKEEKHGFYSNFQLMLKI